MKLGIGSYTYGWSIKTEKNSGLPSMNELDLIDKANQFGIKLLQVGDNIPMHLWNEERLEAFQNSLSKNGIELEIGARGLTQDHISRYIKICQRFRTKVLRFIVDADTYQPSIADIVNIIATNTEELKQNGIILALENHDRFVARDYVQIITQICDSQVGICLDTVNSMGAGENIESIVDTLAPFTVNLHLKDFGIARLPHKQGFIVDGRVAGKGMLNVPMVIEKLKPFNQCHTAVLEQWVPPESNAAATIKKEKQWAEESIKYLRQIDLFSS